MTQTPTPLPTDSGESVFIARQPIFTADNKVWGYELLFRSSATANTAGVLDDDLATSQVIADGFTLARPGLGEGQRVLINFPESLLLEGAPTALPPHLCVVEVLETVTPSPEVLEVIKNIKSEGYTVAMDDYAGEADLDPFLDLADILKVDILALGSDPKRIQQALDRVKGRKPKLLAEKVEDETVFAQCRELGFTLFQGFFFSKPEILPGRKVPAGAAAKLSLLKELSSPDFESSRIAEIINTDPALSYRLFRYVNSAAFGLSRKVESVTHAVNLIGQKPLTHWLQAVILADLNPSARASEVSFLSLQRAKFMGELAPALQVSSQTAFTLGLFSMLDALLRIDMEQVLESLPLEPELADVLTGRAEGELHSMLVLARSYEKADVPAIVDHCERLGLDQSLSDAACVQAMNWVQSVLGLGE